MKHIFHQGREGKPILLLLHGTGGNEHSLIQIARLIDEEASILSVKGNVDENGMARFFRRLEEGIFDEEDLIYRTRELKEFLEDASSKYKFDKENIIGIGYSNGANIATSLLLLYPKSLRAAILHHPMVPLRNTEERALDNKPIFIGAGKNDPICSPEETRELEEILTTRGGDLFLHWENKGHSLTPTELDRARKWYSEKIE